MDETINQNQKNLKGIFPNRKGWTRNDENSPDNPFQFYAVNKEGERYFDLILRSGDEYSIPYALLPSFSLLGGSQIIIAAHELEIRIYGRNLHIIRNHWKKGTLVWVRESPSQRDDDQNAVFISSITIKGKAVIIN